MRKEQNRTPKDARRIDMIGTEMIRKEQKRTPAETTGDEKSRKE